MKDPTDAMGDVLTPMSRVVSAKRHQALLERVAKLERALERVAGVEVSHRYGKVRLERVKAIAQEALND
jgi:hypothetical protein